MFLKFTSCDPTMGQVIQITKGSRDMSKVQFTQRLLKRWQVAVIIGLTPKTITKRVANGTFPQPLRPRGGVPLWTVESIDQWIQSGIVQPEQPTQPPAVGEGVKQAA